MLYYFSERINDLLVIKKYNFTNPNRGKAVIFSHFTFNPKLNLSDRAGTAEDVRYLENTLRDLKFDVTVYHDRFEKEIVQILKNLSKEDHSANDCLAIFVLSHGDHDVLYAYDKEYSVDKLLNNFLGKNCPSLYGKPKLFFLQACRGQLLDRGIIYNSDNTHQMDQTNVIAYHVPSTVDLLIMYATFQRHVSWRNTTTGSWFVQTLCKALNKFARSTDLLTILTSVCHFVAHNKKANLTDDENIIHEFKQMPCIASTLTKLLYFEEKNNENLPTITRFQSDQREPVNFDEAVTHTLFTLSASKTSYTKLQLLLNNNFPVQNFKIEPINMSRWCIDYWTGSRKYNLIIPNDFVNKVFKEIEWPKDVVVFVNTKQKN